MWSSPAIGGWHLDSGQITCPVRVVWGTADNVLQWPTAAARYRDEWLPDAEWITLDGVGHCPQLDVPGRTAELVLAFVLDSSPTTSTFPVSLPGHFARFIKNLPSDDTGVP